MRRGQLLVSAAEKFGAAGDRLLEAALLQLVAVELLKKGQKVGHKFCFSLHVMQTRVHGIAFSLASAIGSPQSRHMP